MELYNFIRACLAWAVTMAALWPVNVPLMAFAYKVRNGPNRITMPRPEFWTRATAAAFLVGLLFVVMVGLDYLVAVGADLPAGPIHMVILIASVPAAAWIVFVFFALEDLMQAVSLVMIYLCLPVLVLSALNWMIPSWEPLDIAYDWLKSPE